MIIAQIKCKKPEPGTPSLWIVGLTHSQLDLLRAKGTVGYEVIEEPIAKGDIFLLTTARDNAAVVEQIKEASEMVFGVKGDITVHDRRTPH